MKQLRNIAIIAHVDHGKTTLVDQLLRSAGSLGARDAGVERVMDSNDIERERGITILSKNTAITWGEYCINIVDTPGHADFGGEVERVLSMVDSVLLVIDAVEGPMPQTRFVTRKAFDHGLAPIVVINKMDRDGARPDWVLDQTFDLFDRLGASDGQLDFPVVYASALQGRSGDSAEVMPETMDAVFDAIAAHCPPPPVNPSGPFQMQISSLAYSSYLGPIGIGRIRRGRVKPNMAVTVVDANGDSRPERLMKVLGFAGLERVQVDSAEAGDIVAVAGLPRPRISETLCDPATVESLPALVVDEPTISVTFETNTSPFAGREGKYVTSRQIRERLDREVLHNVALRVADTEFAERFRVSGRGELHLAVLLETMRREGYEIAVSRPQVIYKEQDGVRMEPFEQLTVDVDDDKQGAVMEALGERGAVMKDMRPDSRGRVRLDFIVPSRGLIGFQSLFRTLTSGTGLMHHLFDHYGPCRPGEVARRVNGVLIANGKGRASGYSLFNLQDRGQLFIGPGEDIYEGQVVGLHSRDNDLTVNPLKGKQLTNVRASGRDENINLSPPRRFTLEQALEFIDDDELIEITPTELRLRKRYLKEHERKRAARA